MYVKRRVAQKWKCGRKIKSKGKGITQRRAKAAQRGAEKNIVLPWARLWPMQKQPFLCGLRVTIAHLCVNLFMICPYPLAGIRPLFTGYKKLRHKKADMDRRANWLKSVKILTNKGWNYFKKIVRGAK